MDLQRWIRKLSARVSSQERVNNGYFLDQSQFRFEAARERMRADRNGSPLAILVIDLPADRSTRRDLLFLGRILRRRLRITDTAGFVPKRCGGGLLPDTPKAGAWKVASDICAVYPVGHDRPSCEVYVYPDVDTSPKDHDDGRPRRQVAPSASTIDGLFASPTPFVKRTIDVLGASVGLIAGTPLIAVCAVIIKATSPGPVFYSQFREGHGGRRFRIHKLRTMRPDAHLHQSALREFSVQDGPAFKMPDDPRITWIGRILRKTSLDELPQLWNVLRGEMSLVGPRPLPVEESLECAPWQRQRLTVLPGMTCVWQVHGRNTVSFEEWMRMDLKYVRRQSFLYDLALILSTAPAVVLKRGPR